jgi:hypothetical protein
LLIPLLVETLQFELLDEIQITLELSYAVRQHGSGLMDHAAPRDYRDPSRLALSILPLAREDDPQLIGPAPWPLELPFHSHDMPSQVEGLLERLSDLSKRASSPQ